MKIQEKIDILSILFQRPDEFVIDNINNGNLREMLGMAFPLFDLHELESSEYREELVNTIKKDYLYLFIGVSKPLASPYQSSYYRKHSRLMDKPAGRIIQIMKKWQIEVDESYRDLPDHIVNILNLLSILLNYREENTDPIIERELKEDIKTIVEDEEWLIRFRDNIKESEDVRFYSILADMLIEVMGQVREECQ